MHDTPRDIDAAYTAMFARFSGRERLQMVSDMFETARALVVANLKDRNPDLTRADLEARLFERLYSGDIERTVLERIITSLRQ